MSSGRSFLSDTGFSGQSKIWEVAFVCVLRFQFLFYFDPYPNSGTLCVVYSDSMLPSKYVAAVDIDDHTHSIRKVTFYTFKEKSELM